MGNEDRNVKNDINLLKKQAKDLEYGHQRLKGLMTNQRQNTQVPRQFVSLHSRKMCRNCMHVPVSLNCLSVCHLALSCLSSLAIPNFS